MSARMLTSAYFFFYICFTYFYMGKAYLGFTEKEKFAAEQAG